MTHSIEGYLDEDNSGELRDTVETDGDLNDDSYFDIPTDDLKYAELGDELILWVMCDH